MTDYTLLLRQAESLMEGETHPLPAMANLSALLFSSLNRLNWAGFYLMEGGSLMLGPFQGKVACIRIQLGRGVCGTAAAQDAPQVIRDVHEFPGHIACDSASNSELVIPVHADGKVVGVLDLDSPETGRFTDADRDGLLPLVGALEALCDWKKLKL